MSSTSTYLVYKRRKKISVFDVLPSEILVCILSYLTLKEAVKTSVLSSKWRYLWQFTSGTLDFDFNYLDLNSWTGEADFTRCVNQIMKLHQSPSIDKLFIRFSPPSNKIYYPFFETWISFAMKKNVKNLQIDLSRQLHLHLDLFLSKKTKIFLGHNLTCVKFHRIGVTDELIEHIVSHAPRIENLTVMYSYLPQNLLLVGSTLKSFNIAFCSYLKSLKVVCPSLLTLKVGDCRKLNTLDVVAVNLVSLRYFGSKLMRDFMDVIVHPLCEFQLTRGYYRRALLSCFTTTRNLPKYYGWLENLKKLKLALPNFHSTDFFLMPSLFHNLKQLDLHVTFTGEDIGYVRLFVVGCPLLSELVIRLVYWPFLRLDSDSEKEKEKYEQECYYHKYLQLVKIINFAGLRTDIDLALWFLIVPTLDKMIIRIFVVPPDKTISHSEARTKAMGLLQYLSKKTKLVVL